MKIQRDTYDEDEYLDNNLPARQNKVEKAAAKRDYEKYRELVKKEARKDKEFRKQHGLD